MSTTTIDNYIRQSTFDDLVNIAQDPRADFDRMGLAEEGVGPNEKEQCFRYFCDRAMVRAHEQAVTMKNIGFSDGVAKSVAIIWNLAQAVGINPITGQGYDQMDEIIGNTDVPISELMSGVQRSSQTKYLDMRSTEDGSLVNLPCQVSEDHEVRKSGRTRPANMPAQHGPNRPPAPNH